MAKKSSSMFSLLLYAVGGYLVYENWPAISAWAGSIVAAPAAPTAGSAGANYPNSPVPASFSTMQTFVDSAGNQWQFSTQTNQWVIATPGTPPSPSAGMVVASPPKSVPVAPAPPTTVPASPGTLVPVQPAPTYLPTQPGLPIVRSVLAQQMPAVTPRGFTPVRANV